MRPPAYIVDEARRVMRQWEGGEPPCGIPHTDIYNPCLPERDWRGLCCVTCGLRQRLALTAAPGGMAADG